MTRTRAGGPRTRGPLARAFPLALAALLGLWWLALAPAALGGPATYVLVQGHSMLPLLAEGDLAVASTRTGHGVGDLVVLRTDGGGLVIHRLASGSATAGWRTQGDNNPAEDAWTVPDDAVLGTFALSVPGVGTALTAVAAHPIPFASALALLAVASYLPWHRRRVAPVLASALRRAQHEPGRDGRPVSEYGALVLAGTATLACLASVTVALVRHSATTDLRLVAAAAGLTVAGTTAVTLAYRMFDGKSLPEPLHSTHALSGRLYLVAELPAVSDVTPVGSATELRELAERERLPVLHRIDDWTGTNDFLLVTADDGAFLWTARPTHRAAPRGRFLHDLARRRAALGSRWSAAHPHRA